MIDLKIQKLLILLFEDNYYTTKEKEKIGKKIDELVNLLEELK